MRTKISFLRPLLCILLVLACVSAYSSSKTPGKVIAGYVEKIVVEHQGYTTKAKLDTGAKTSSIFAENIERFRVGKERWVRFTLVLEDSKNTKHKVTLERPRSRRVKIKNHDGAHDHRPVIKLNICFNGRIHNTEFTLANRSEYIYTTLLGRDFLNGVAIIDPEETFLTLASCS
jgi:hypothetical protein